MAQLTTASDDNFNAEVIDSDRPVLVDFWAEWCHPCRLIDPAVKEIAQEKGEALKVAKLNIDDNPNTARNYGVMSIPTLILFVDGAEKARIVGAHRKERIVSEIEPFLTAETRSA